MEINSKDGFCGAGEEVKELSDGYKHLSFKFKYEHVLSSFGDNSGCHSPCYGKSCGGSVDKDGLNVKEREYLNTLPLKATKLIEAGEAFLGYCHNQKCLKQGDFKCSEYGCNGYKLCLILNDTFSYASADAEDLPTEKLDEIYDIYEKYGPTGLVCWAAKQRNEDPVVEYTEDSVYLETYKSLYGDSTLKQNYTARTSHRWSNVKLNLKKWLGI